MRMVKGFGIAMAVVALVVGLALGASAASDSVSVNASFSILSWILPLGRRQRRRELR